MHTVNIRLCQLKVLIASLYSCKERMGGEYNTICRKKNLQNFASLA